MVLPARRLLFMVFWGSEGKDAPFFSRQFWFRVDPIQKIEEEEEKEKKEEKEEKEEMEEKEEKE